MAGPIPRRALIVGSALLALGAVPALAMRMFAPFPPDTTPEGAYLRVVLAITEDHVEKAFAYLETEAQWGCITLHDYERRAYALIAASYADAEPEKARLLAQYRLAHEAPTPEIFFARTAQARGWVQRLRRDLSGIARVEASGERATIETARGTRYPFRRRDNGIWGMTQFTAELREGAERAARDFSVVEKAARDYAQPASSR